jgi:multidrug resistance efflux pump
MLNLSSSRVDKPISQERFYSLRSLQTPSAGKLLAKILFVLFLILIAALFLPWQQNIRGKGSVTALAPANRPQTIETAIAGRIKEWKIREGQYVDKGDTIAILSEVKEKYFDPKMLQRLREIIQAKESSLNSKKEKSISLKKQIKALEDALESKLEQAKAKLEAEKVRFANAKNQFERSEKLYEAGNIPLTKFQDTYYKFQGSQADLKSAEIEIERLPAEFKDKINKAESDWNNTLSEQFETDGEVTKLRNELTNMEIRGEQYFILAPQNGYVIKASQGGIGETIKEGDPLCTILPSSNDVAVEMYVTAMDVPLISRGRKVRIEFDGFPALQFSGWPSVSVGSFGGIVEVIDYASAKAGQFRILVVPDKADEKWPKQIRVGSGTKGWVMLNDVPIWWELWRQLNGFPVSLYQEPELDQPIKKSDTKSEEK